MYNNVHRFIMELDLQSSFSPHVMWFAQRFSLAGWDPETATPRIGAHIRGGRYWSAKIDDISF